MEELAEFANECSKNRQPGEFCDTDDGEDEIVFTPKDIAGTIIDKALEGFEECGPYAEVPGIPYTSAYDLVTEGLLCDPCGGSTSSCTFMETMLGG